MEFQSSKGPVFLLSQLILLPNSAVLSAAVKTLNDQSQSYCSMRQKEDTDVSRKA